MISKLSIPKEKLTKQNGNINFNFYHKVIGSKKAYFLGYARVNLMEVVEARYSFFKKCPVRDENGLSLGMVVLKLDLGSKGIHFGDSFIREFFLLNFLDISIFWEVQ